MKSKVQQLEKGENEMKVVLQRLEKGGKEMKTALTSCERRIQVVETRMLDYHVLTSLLTLSFYMYLK